MKDKHNGQTISYSEEKRETTQITEIRNERRDITTDATEMKRIIRDNYEKL